MSSSSVICHTTGPKPLPKRFLNIVRSRRGRRHKKLLYDLKDRRGYCQLKEEALLVDRTMRRNRFGSGFGPVFSQIRDDDDDYDDDEKF